MQETNTTARTGVDILRRLADAFNARDFDRAHDLLSDGLVFVDFAMGRTINGRDRFVDHARAWAGAFSDMQLEPLAFVGDDRYAAGDCRSRSLSR
jgi:ketosteroid isomerase-like protein